MNIVAPSVVTPITKPKELHSKICSNNFKHEQQKKILINITKYQNFMVRKYGFGCVKNLSEEHAPKDFLLSDCDFVKE